MICPFERLVLDNVFHLTTGPALGEGQDGLVVNPIGLKAITSQYCGDGLFLSSEDLKMNAQILNVTIIGVADNDKHPVPASLLISYTISQLIPTSDLFEVTQRIYIEEVNTRRGGGDILSLLPHLKKPTEDDDLVNSSDGVWKIMKKYAARYEKLFNLIF